MRLASLSDREIEVLRLLSHGKTNRQVAKELKISLRSVEKEVAGLKQKLGIATTNELILYSAREGLVYPEMLGCEAGQAY